MAAISRSDHLEWKEQRSGKRGGTKQERHKRTNWYHPFLWAHIDRAAKVNDWSPQAMINTLKKEQPKLFSRLHKGTISRWIDRTKRQWSVATLVNIQNGHSLAGSGQSGILCHYPQVKEEIVEKLKSLRASGLPINIVIARSIMLAVIQDRAPNLLKTFKCSEVGPISFARTLHANIKIEICSVLL